MNFSSLSTINAQPSSAKYLKPWGIYKVKLESIEKDTIQGKKDPSKVFKVMRVKFVGDEGEYTEQIFFPDEANGDDQIKEFTKSDGSVFYMPSNLGRTLAFIAQICSVLNPEGYAQLQKASGKLKTFDMVLEAFQKVAMAGANKEVELKLGGMEDKRNGRIYAALPNFIAVNRDKEEFVSDQFIGENLSFTPYEVKKMKEYREAKPSVMKETADIPNIPNVAAAQTESASSKSLNDILGDSIDDLPF